MAFFGNESIQARAVALTAAALLTLALGGCGGGGSSDGSGVSGLTCDTSLFAEGADVALPTADQLSAFATTYSGQEGTYDDSFNFTPTGPAELELTDQGEVTYNGTVYDLVSACYENVGGATGEILYLHFDAGHVDLFSDGAWSGISPKTGNAIVGVAPAKLAARVSALSSGR